MTPPNGGKVEGKHLICTKSKNIEDFTMFSIKKIPEKVASYLNNICEWKQLYLAYGYWLWSSFQIINV